ncbi:MAG: Dam family site-specific DNA-(adenine-N6)-methyltransferase [Anaerolineales bacterium]|jgi:DNA adenine methylase|nr:Dam family site-specific DNA-(adenine-N6)-methyltransferase [Anaerolineales bacterium]
MRIAVPPLKCQGIKTHLVEWILDHVSLSEGGTWIEPFMGSGVVGFNVRPAKAIFADTNLHIINLYNAIKNEQITPGIAKEFLEREGKLLSEKGQAHYYEIRERFNQTGESLDLLFLNRSSFNGVMRFNKSGKFNVPFGHKPQRFAQAYVTKIINQIRQVSQTLSMYDWQFVCADFRHTLAAATEKDLIYCDPPYIGRHTDYFNGWSEKDEQDLFDILAETKARFIISTWHSNQYRKNLALEKYAKNFTVFTRQHFYHVGASEKNRNPMLEAIVLNYDPAPQLEAIPMQQLAFFDQKADYKFRKIIPNQDL